ncbi:MAG: hypothetical protein RLZZ143_3100, partial [Cyanobacteriota bacterium]
EVQKLWVLGKRQEAKGKREEKYMYLTSLGNAILSQVFRLLILILSKISPIAIKSIEANKM